MGAWSEQVVPRFTRKALGAQRHHDIRAGSAPG
jgi:hypothetical protein